MTDHGGEVKPILSLKGVSKHFPGVFAVQDVSLDILQGEVHAVAGENGAGKSTLMKLLSQVEYPDAGEILMEGKRVEFRGPRHAQALGIAMVYQEFALAPHLTVAENLFLGREPGRMGTIDLQGERRLAGALLERVGLKIDPRRVVSSLSVAERQMLEIAKALAISAKVVIMDEPTATLTDHEIEELFSVIADLKTHGIAVVYISHRLEEVFRIADRVTVMRDGGVVATSPAKELTPESLIRQMVGRNIENLYPKPTVQLGDVILRAQGISRDTTLQNCSFEVRRGEIVGLGGLIGAGRTELARAVFGADPIDSGRIELDGKVVHVDSPAKAIQLGIGYLSEDRKRDGLALQLGVATNITLAHLPMASGLIDLGAERRTGQNWCRDLNIRTPSINREVYLLSGGNQQKVVVAKWLETRAKLLFFDEPARGIDVGAKAEMFELIGRLARDGRGIVLISSYLPELINMCDRIIVMHEGRIAGEVARAEFSEERIVALATGAVGEAA